MRLNQYLARCGVCSRRGADNLINSGKVTINGETAKLGADVDESMTVCVNGKQVFLPNNTEVWAYYKPVGVVCTEKDAHAKRIVTDEMKADRRLTYAGRLDKDSEGLLIMTDDGNLINSMMRGSNMHEKEYVVTVDKPVKPSDVAKMCKGVYLKDLETTTRECIVEQLDDKTLRFVLTQGLNRQIRRMCGVFGYKVVKLLRTRVMNISIENLQVGASRKLTDDEKMELYKLCKLK